MSQQRSLRLGVLVLVGLLAGCSPAATPVSPTPTATPRPLASPSPSPAASPSPSPAASPSPSPAASPPAAGPPASYLRILEANAAFAREDYSTALRLYRMVASDGSPVEAGQGRPVPPGPDLRAFARFRIVVTDAIVGQEDDARAILEAMEREEPDSPFRRLALVFWDTYGMTADVRAACGQVTRIVQANPQPYLRSLNGWGPAGRDFGPSDICPSLPS